MQVKLSYTVDEEEIHEEASKLLGLKSPAMQHLIDLFNDIQGELKPTENEVVNSSKVEELIDDFRTTLAGIDLRLAEIHQIIVAYEDYKRRPAEPERAVEPSAPESE
jgi:hypothetical protein|tara:strand:- start:1207 stop:1527 length:321 start_codon:yes stop_codon:yes gene_type:complete